tara:strand:+ start:383 stop:1222 length:840 start_codon:yes stop_codon:yes gene_type:complete
MSNRAQRRAEERAKKKQGINTEQVEVEFMQPWSDVLMKTRLTDEVLEAMIDITDQILQDPDRKNWGDNLAGQIQDEPLIPHQMLMDYKIGKDGNVFNWLMNMVGEYVKACSRQQATSADYDKVKDVEWLTQMKSAWVVSQWEGEYNPIHIHTECAMSTVLYLKVPEFLPSTKPKRDDDGCIMFIGAGHQNARLTRNIIKHKPKPGDFFLFPAHLQHCVYPFKTEDDAERRSVSFNADFIAKHEFEKQQEMVRQQQQQQAPPKPMPGAPEKLTIRTDDSI